MSRKASQIPGDKLELYEKLIETHPEIERKGVTNPYTSHNGHMFSHLSKEGTLGLRLPKDVREKFLEDESEKSQLIKKELSDRITEAEKQAESASQEVDTIKEQMEAQKTRQGGPSAAILVAGGIVLIGLIAGATVLLMRGQSYDETES